MPFPKGTQTSARAGYSHTLARLKSHARQKVFGGASPRLKFTRVLFICFWGEVNFYLVLCVANWFTQKSYIGTYSTTSGNLKVCSVMFGWGVLIGSFGFTVKGRSKEAGG